MSGERPLRVAVVGCGSFGQNHVRVLADLEGCELTAVVDSDAERRNALGASHGCSALATHEELAGKVDAAVVAVPTVHHAEVGCWLLSQGIDVLVEKPIATTIEEAERLVATARLHSKVLQVGHLERFNPAVIALRKVLTVPLFFEIHRLTVFSPRSLDVDVVLDLMIHDLDLVLALVGSEPEDIRAAGVSILSGKVDIANVRLAFAGGCVANLTASRVSTERVRKLRLFQPSQYISLDYQRQDGMVYTVSGSQNVSFAPLAATKDEPLRLELSSFRDAVLGRAANAVPGEDGVRALRLATAIRTEMESHSATVAAHLASLSAPVGS